jgi:SAM-dependent methyltransferase
LGLEADRKRRITPWRHAMTGTLTRQGERVARERSHWDAVSRTGVTMAELVRTRNDPALGVFLDNLERRPLVVLDLGCGRGLWSLLLAHQLDDIRITGVDVSAVAIRAAHDSARSLGFSGRVRFLQSSAYELPFASGTFDAVIGVAILHHLALEDAAAEIRRVIRPGGCAIFCENNGDDRVLTTVRSLLYRLPWFRRESEDAHPVRLSELAVVAGKFTVWRAWFPYVCLFTTLGWRPGLGRVAPLLRVLDRLLSNPFTERISMIRWVRFDT